MQLSKFHVPDGLAQGRGLKNGFTLERLGKCVILGGKNGAGKSRILSLVRDVCHWFSIGYSNEIQKNNLHAYTVAYSSHEESMRNASIVDAYAYHGDEMIHLKAEEQQEPFKLTAVENSVLTGVKDKIIEFVPKSTVLTDPQKKNKTEILNQHSCIASTTMENIEDAALAYIQVEAEKYIAVTHPIIKLSQSGHSGPNIIQTIKHLKEKIIDSFRELDALIFKFLGTTITLNEKLEAMIFNMPLGKAKLSQGQSILLQLCVKIHAQGGSIGSSIIILDEPENHLHPDVLLKIIDIITKNIGDGQLWIATHSIHVLAHFDPTEIFFVEDGDISYGGRQPEKVLKSLLGSDEERGRVANFLSLPEEIAFNIFSYQCLLMPQVLFTGKDDPQVRQIHKILIEKGESEKKLRILDFGMGKGRLLSTLRELYQVNKESFVDRIDYYGFDKFTDYKSECEALLNEVYKGNKTRYFNKKADLRHDIPEEFFDVIIMCNVLHEIPPAEWAALFADESSVFTRLNRNGTLLIIEDQLLPVGESPHSKGYIVLNSEQMRILFNTSSDKGYGVWYDDSRKRLAAHIIPARDIANVSDETKNKAIKSLFYMAKENIEEHRMSGEISFAAGRKHAFWVHQLANATLALGSMK